MTKQDKLQAVIEYGVKKEYLPYKDPSCLIGYTKKENKFWIQCGMGGISYHNIYELIFSHDFAKAFWGKGDRVVKEHCPGCECGGDIYQQKWKHHLQQAVISEDPIDYYFKKIESSNKQP